MSKRPAARGSSCAAAFASRSPGRSQPVTYCHCTSCKKLSGGVGTANGRARTDEIQCSTARACSETLSAATEGSAKSFCSVCGSNLFGGGWPDAEDVKRPS